MPYLLAEQSPYHRHLYAKVLQFLESFTDLRRIVLVGLSVGLVELIQHGLAVTITGVKWMCLDRKPQTVITTNRKPMVMGVIER